MNKYCGRIKITTAFCILLAFMFMSVSPALADDSYEIYTYGSGDFVAQVFTGVALLFSGNYIQSLVKVILLIGLLTVLLNPVSAWLSRGAAVAPTGGEGFLAIVRQTLLAVIAVYVFIIPKTNVAIIDRVDPSQSQVIGNVPFVQGIIAHGASMVGDVIGREMESAFSLPDEMKFRENGIGIGIKRLNSIYDVMPPSPSMYNNNTASAAVLISASLKDYFNQCVFKNFAVLDGPTGPKTKALHELMNSTDALTTMENNASLFGDPNITIVGPTASGYTTCDQAVTVIRSAWLNGKTEWLKEIEKNTNSGTTEAVLSHYFPDGGDTFVMLQNIAVGNMMKSAVRNYNAATTGDTNALGDELVLERTLGGWQTTAKMFEKIVNVMRNVFEGLIYGLSVLLPVAIAVAGLSPLGTYLKIVLWLQLWVPFYVLLNLFGDMEMSRSLDTLAQQSGGGFISIAQWREVGEKAQVALGYLGSLAFTVPMFAWGLMKGGEFAMSSAIQAMTGGATAVQQAQKFGGGAAVGDVSLDNQSIGNKSWRSGTTVGSQVAFEIGSGQMTGRVNVLGEGMTSFGSSTQTFSDQSTIGNVSGGMELAKNFTGGSVMESSRVSAIQNGADALARSTNLTNTGSNSIDAANANAKAFTGETLANQGLDQKSHNLIATTSKDEALGHAKGVTDYSKSIGSDVENLTKKLTTFDMLSKDTKVDATKAMAGALHKSTRGLLFEMDSVGSRADGSGVHSFGVSGGRIVSDQVTSGHGTTHYANSHNLVTGSEVNFGTNQMTSAIMSGDSNSYLSSVGGGKNMWHDKNIGMAAAMHTADVVGKYVETRQGENNSTNLTYGGNAQAGVKTPGISPVSASAS
ncbi:MAG: conjugal transfer protein TraG N-terminal domain-containing protein, partial [Smithella sp.]